MPDGLDGLRMCNLCPYAMHALLVEGGPCAGWVMFFCERCDR